MLLVGNHECFLADWSIGIYRMPWDGQNL
jgi:hypothetical protein